MLEELLDQALEAVGRNQAELARRVNRAETTVSRWLAGFVKPDYESCLRLARITGKSSKLWLEAAGLDPRLIPTEGIASGTQPALDPQLAAFLAAIEAGWLSMDTPIRDVAERGALALFSVPPTQRRAIGRQDRTAKRLRQLNDARPTGEDEPPANDSLINRSHAVARFTNPWHSTQATAMSTL